MEASKIVAPPKEATKEQKFESFDWKFETFNDKTLVLMLENVKAFVNKIIKGETVFMTLSGPTEVGKTFLLERAERLLKSLRLRFRRPAGYIPVLYIKWYELVNEMFDYETKRQAFTNVKNAGVLILEEFLKDNLTLNNPRNAIVLDFAHEVLDVRLGKPTLMDTNKSLAELEGYDVRIASRLLRHGGIFLSINKDTMKYYMRKK